MDGGSVEDSTDSLQEYRLAATNVDLALQSPLDAEGRSTSPLPRRRAHLESDITQAQRALHAFLSNRHEEARGILQELIRGGESLYGSLGMGLLFLLRALLTFAPEDAATSREHLQSALQIAQRMRKGLAATTVYARLARIFNRRTSSRDGPPPDDKNDVGREEEAFVQRHLELVTAECHLMGALLTVLTDTSGSWIMFMRESLHIRTAYLIYHSAFTNMATATAVPGEPADPHYESGVLLGSGLINVLFSLLPPRIFSLFSFLGYSGGLEVGLAQLQGAVACRTGIRSPWAELALLLYHTVFAGALAIRPPPATGDGQREGMDREVSSSSESLKLTFTGPNESAGGTQSAITSPHPTDVLIEEILTRRLEEYPDCPLYLFFRARQLILKSEIDEAIRVLEGALALPPLQWPQLLQTCAWELMTTSMVQLNWPRCCELATQLSEETRWSRCTALYLQAIFLTAASEGSDPSVRDLVMRLYGRVMREETRIAGRRLAMEKYATLRAEQALTTGELPFYPELELLLVWDVFMRMSTSTLSQLRAQLDVMERDAHGSLDVEKQGLIVLCRAAILRAAADYGGAEAILRQLLSTDAPTHSYIYSVAHAELAQCALLQHRLDVAREHYQLSAGYPHKFLLQRSLHLRQAKIKAELDRLS